MAEDAKERPRWRVSAWQKTGAASVGEARQGRPEGCGEPVVKCSLFGADPYWGRIVSELGSAGIDFDPTRVEIAYGDVVVRANGVAVGHDEAAVRAPTR